MGVGAVLTKEMGPADLPEVTKLQFGASWDPSTGNSGRIMGFARKTKGVDLDLIGIAMNTRGEPVRLAGLDSLDPFGNGSMTHSGDNFTGAGAGDDETLTLDLSNVPTIVGSIVFVAAAFKKGSSFTAARNVAFTAYDASNGTPEELTEIWPSLLGAQNACAIAKAIRTSQTGSLGNTVWQLQILENFGTIKQGDDQSLMRFGVGQ